MKIIMMKLFSILFMVFIQATTGKGCRKTGLDNEAILVRVPPLFFRRPYSFIVKIYPYVSSTLRKWFTSSSLISLFCSSVMSWTAMSNARLESSSHFFADPRFAFSSIFSPSFIQAATGKDVENPAEGKRSNSIAEETSFFFSPPEFISPDPFVMIRSVSV